MDRNLIACGRIDGGFRLGGGVGGDQTATKGEVVAAVAIGEEAIVADAVEAVRQGMEKKAGKRRMNSLASSVITLVTPSLR